MDSAPNKNKLPSILTECDTFCNMSYIYEMHNLDCCLCKPTNSEIGFIKISKFPECDIWHSFSYILNSLCTLGSALGYIFTIEDDKPIIYIGISSNLYLHECIDIIYNGLSNMFSNINPTILTPEQSTTLLSKVFSTNMNAISSVSTIPGDTQRPILNNFSDIMPYKDEFYLLLLATPCAYTDIVDWLTKLRLLSSTLTNFSIEERAFVNTITRGSSAGSSTSLTSTNGRSNSSTENCGSAVNYAEYTNLSPSTSLPICEKNNVNLSLVANQGKGHNSNTGTSCTKGCSDSDAKTKGCNDQSSTNHTETTRLGFIFKNKNIIDAIDKIDKLIIRLQDLTSYSSMNFCAYVLSPNVSITATASNVYLGCSNPPSIPVPIHTNMWTSDSVEFGPVLDSLSQFTHPHFTFNYGSKPYESTEVTSSHIISTYELMNSLYFI